MLGLSKEAYYQRNLREEAPLEPGRGRDADRPGQLPRAGWRDILWRVYEEQSKDNISMVAAGVAFYAMLAIFPALAALVSIYGLIADPQQIQQQFQALSGFLPKEATDVLMGQMTSIASASGSGLGLGAAIGLALALWSASRGVSSLLTSLNIVYDEKEERGFFSLAALSLLLTLGAILFVIVALTLVVAVPAFIGTLNLGEPVEWLVRIARWPVLAMLVMLALGILYRFGPDRARPQWRWVSWGATAATVLWLIGSIAFSVYVANFGNYNKTYGSVGAVVILLLWLQLTSYAVLIGGELNAEMEHQTARDTTSGQPRQIGRRGAFVADTVGRRP